MNEDNNSQVDYDLSGWSSDNKQEQPQKDNTYDLSGWSSDSQQQQPKQEPQHGLTLPKGYSDPLNKLTSALETVPSRALHDVAQTGIDIGQAAYHWFTGKPIERYTLDKWDKFDHEDVGVQKGTVNDQIADMGTWFTGFGAAGKALTAIKSGQELSKAAQFLHGIVSGAAADFTMGDPWHEKLADVAYALTKNNQEPNAFTETFKALKTDKNDSAFDERLKNVADGAVFGGITEGAMKVFGSLFKGAAKVARTGRTSQAAAMVDDAVDHMNNVQDKLQNAVTDAGTLKPEVAQDIADKAEAYKATARIASNDPVYDDVVVPFDRSVDVHAEKPEEPKVENPVGDDLESKVTAPKATRKKAEDGDRQELKDSVYNANNDPRLKDYTDVIKNTISDNHAVITKRSMTTAFNRLVKKVGGEDEVYDLMRSIGKSKRFGAEDGAFAQHAYNRALSKVGDLVQQGVTGEEFDKAMQNATDMAEVRRQIGEHFGQIGVHMRYANDMIDGIQWDKMGENLKAMGVSEDEVAKMRPDFNKISKQVDKRKERMVSNLKRNAYTPEQIEAYMKAREPELKDYAAELLKKSKLGRPMGWVSKAKLMQSELMLMNPITWKTSIVSGLFQSYYRPMLSIGAGMLRRDMRQVRQGAYLLSAFSRELFNGDVWKATLKAFKDRKGSIVEMAKAGGDEQGATTLANEVSGGDALPWYCFNLRAMTAQDELFKQANYRAAAEARYRAMNHDTLKLMDVEERTKAIKQAVDDLIEDGQGVDEQLRQYTMETTFSENREGDTLAKIESLIRQFPKVGMIVMPFVHTPFNIMRFTLRQTPLGYYSKGVQDILREGTPEQKAELKVAWTLWSGVSLWLTGKTLNGEATGGYSSDPKVRQAQMDSGVPRYAVKFGDTWVSYEKADFGTPFKILANVCDAVTGGNKNDEDTSQIVMESAFAGVKGILDNSMLTGISQFMGAMGQDGLNNQAATYFASLITRPIPPAYTKVAQWIDGQGDIQEALNFQEKVLRKVAPWTLSDRRDWLTGAVSNFPPDVMGFKYQHQADLDLVHQRVQAVGGVNAISTTLSDGIQLNGEQKSYLTKVMTQDIKNSYGQTLYQAVKELTDSPQWHMYPTDRHGLGGTNWQQQQVQRLVNLYKTQAEVRLLKKYPELQQEQEQRAQQLAALMQPQQEQQ
ncbi:TPA: hypothetical protein ACX6Q6_003557 [Photobacterium damselae]